MIIINAYTGVTEDARILKKKLKESGVKVSISQIPTSKNKMDVIVNWNITTKIIPGDTENYTYLLNSSLDIARISDRLEFYMKLGTPEWLIDWTSLSFVAAHWATGRNKVVCHEETKEEIHSRRLQLWCQDDGAPGLPVVPLYTRYFHRTAEYRVHICRDWADTKLRVHFVQRKIFVPSSRHPHPTVVSVRNKDTGFCWIKNPAEFPVPMEVLEVAQNAFRQGFPGLNFCAIDVLYNADKKQALVLKGTTAPSLTGTVADAYCAYFVRVYRKIQEKLYVKAHT
jgi:hypothetical protein